MHAPSICFWRPASQATLQPSPLKIPPSLPPPPLWGGWGQPPSILTPSYQAYMLLWSSAPHTPDCSLVTLLLLYDFHQKKSYFFYFFLLPVNFPPNISKKTPALPFRFFPPKNSLKNYYILHTYFNTSYAYRGEFFFQCYMPINEAVFSNPSMIKVYEDKKLILLSINSDVDSKRSFLFSVREIIQILE